MLGAVFCKQQCNEPASGAHLEHCFAAEIEAGNGLLQGLVAVVVVEHGEMPCREVAAGGPQRRDLPAFNAFLNFQSPPAG